MFPLRGRVEEVMVIGYIMSLLWMLFIGSAKPIKNKGFKNRIMNLK
jgi:hypothetical protein